MDEPFKKGDVWVQKEDVPNDDLVWRSNVAGSVHGKTGYDLASEGDPLHKHYNVWRKTVAEGLGPWRMKSHDEMVEAFDIVIQYLGVDLDLADEKRNTASKTSKHGYVTCQPSGYGSGDMTVKYVLVQSGGIAVFTRVGPSTPKRRQLPRNAHFSEPLPLP